MSTSESYHFGEYRVDVDQRVVLRAGEAIALSPKGFELLVLLVRRPGHAFSRQELMTCALAGHVRRRSEPVVPGVHVAQGAGRRRGALDRDRAQAWLSLRGRRPDRRPHGRTAAEPAGQPRRHRRRDSRACGPVVARWRNEPPPMVGRWLRSAHAGWQPSRTPRSSAGGPLSRAATNHSRPLG